MTRAKKILLFLIIIVVIIIAGVIAYLNFNKKSQISGADLQAKQACEKNGGKWVLGLWFPGSSAGYVITSPDSKAFYSCSCPSLMYWNSHNKTCDRITGILR